MLLELSFHAPPVPNTRDALTATAPRRCFRGASKLVPLALACAPRHFFVFIFASSSLFLSLFYRSAPFPLASFPPSSLPAAPIIPVGRQTRDESITRRGTNRLACLHESYPPESSPAHVCALTHESSSLATTATVSCVSSLYRLSQLCISDADLTWPDGSTSTGTPERAIHSSVLPP